MLSERVKSADFTQGFRYNNIVVGGGTSEAVAAGMAAEKAVRAGLEPLGTPRTRRPHVTGMTFPEANKQTGRRPREERAGKPLRRLGSRRDGR